MLGTSMFLLLGWSVMLSCSPWAPHPAMLSPFQTHTEPAPAAIPPACCRARGVTALGCAPCLRRASGFGAKPCLGKSSRDHSPGGMVKAAAGSRYALASAALTASPGLGWPFLASL